MESVWADVRYGLRQLRKAPGFAIAVAVTMALGIGANTAIFTLVHAVLMKSLPVGDPQSLYRLGDKQEGSLTAGLQNENGDFDAVSYTHLHSGAPGGKNRRTHGERAAAGGSHAAGAEGIRQRDAHRGAGPGSVAMASGGIGLGLSLIHI